MKNILSISHLSHTYHTLKEETPALSDLTFSLFEGGFYSLVGPSGCGKSTLLSLIAGLLPIEDGSIFVQGQPVSAPIPEKIGYMLQKDELFPWLTIQKNVTLGLRLQHSFRPDLNGYIDHLLQQYGLLPFSSYYPDQLSGGMRQRAALIRTLALRPPLLLLDEPFSALDPQTRLLVSSDIASIIHKEQKTVLLVTHDLAEAISLSDRIFVLSERPGRLIDICNIEFPPDLDPLEKRNHPLFQTYFQHLYKEIQP